MKKNNPFFNFIGLSAPERELTGEQKQLEDRRRALRIASVVLVLVCTVFLAMAAGTMIALWDTGKSSHDFFMLLNGSYVYARTQDELNNRVQEETGQADEDVAADSKEQGLEVVNEVAEGGDDTDEAAGDDNTADILTEEAETAGIGDVEEAGDSTDAGLIAASDINVFIDPNVNYPMPFTTVDESYFEDALFIGDSRLQGFGMYSGMPGTFYAATGFQLYKYDSMKVVNTDAGKVPIMDALPYDTFTKIYIKVGLNEMGGNDNVFANKYAELIARLRESEPRAIIYVHGILPVTASKSQSDKVHNNANVVARNEGLKQIAIEQKAYYLDVGSAVANADGSLPAEMAADGIHLKAQYMDIWKQYLLSHAVVVTQ